MTDAAFTLRPATAADCDTLLRLIAELAEYEKLDRKSVV